MDVQATAEAELAPRRWRLPSMPIRIVAAGWIQRHGWWIVAPLAVVTIVVGSFVRSWTDCRYFYQAEMGVYLANPGAFVRPPEQAALPVPTVLIRIAGQVVNMLVTWVGWAGSTYLLALLLGQTSLPLGTAIRVIAWSWLPFVVRGVAQCGYMWLTGDPIFNPGLSGLFVDNTPPAPGGGYHFLMPTQRQVILAALLSQVDVYLFWQLGLMVRGLQRSGGFTFRKALTITLVVVTVMASLGLLPSIFQETFSRFRFF